ncbi:unnamed protein product [Linum trigynum]|uniref:Uncharacterized protein n=1 Tax=Linum trigynum TaxID=586398 RepID=A0AAV2FW75_9ROSI
MSGELLESVNEPLQLEPPMRLRADGFPQFDFQLPSMVGSRGRSSHSFGTRDHHTSPLEPLDEIDDESKQYESDAIEDRSTRQFDQR